MDVTEQEQAEAGAEAFEFEESDLATAAALLNRLAAPAGDPSDVASACHVDAGFQALPARVQGEITTLLGYELDDRDGRGVRLGPEGERDGWWAVRPLSATPAGVPDFWTQLRPMLDEGVALAQLDDVILTTRTDVTPSHATATVKQYLQVAARADTDSFHAALAAVRALTISRSRRMTDERDAWEAGVALAGRQLSTGTPPGGPARLFQSLVQPVSFELSDSDRIAVLELLDRAEDLYSDANAADWIADCRRKLARTEQERENATNHQVARYLAAADDAEEGFVKMYWASRAAELARIHGAHDAHDSAVRMMQSIPADAMDWQSFDATIPVPTVAIRSYIRRVARADSWQSALATFLASPSPAGSYKRNQKTALAAAKGSIRAIFSTTVFGSHGMPERTRNDFDEGEILRTEQLAISMNGLLINEELREINRRFGPIATTELATHVAERYGSDRELATEYAYSLELFWEERYSDAARLLIPLIEAGARGLLLRLDEAIYRVERGESPGRFPTMDFYLDKLESLGLDIDWVRALRVALLSPGSNVRNMAAHGFKFNFGAAETAVLIRLAGLFCALPTDVDEDERRKLLSHPLRSVRRRLRRRLGWTWT